MYESFYGFSDNPFRIAPDPAFFYASAGHKRAQAYLRYGVFQGQGFVVITGAPGTGKSLLLQTLLQELPPNEYVVAKISNTNLQADDILRAVAESFGIREKAANKAEQLSMLEAFLHSHVAMGRSTILVVDEAQNLPRRSLEELRMLSNYQLNEKPLLQIVLIGQEQFRETLADKSMEQLTQRVIAASNLLPITAMETRGYIGHRLSRVGWQGNPRISGQALRLIFLFTQGVPRLINVFCDRLLLAGALDECIDIDEAMVRKVVAELANEPGALWSPKVDDPDAAGIEMLPALPEENVIPSPRRSVASPPVVEELDTPSGAAPSSEPSGQWSSPSPQLVDAASPMPPQAPANSAAPESSAPAPRAEPALATGDDESQPRSSGSGLRSAPLRQVVRESQLANAERAAARSNDDQDEEDEALPPAKIIELPIPRAAIPEEDNREVIDELLDRDDMAAMQRSPTKGVRWRIVVAVLLLAIVAMVSSIGTYFFLLRDTGGDAFSKLSRLLQPSAATSATVTEGSVDWQLSDLVYKFVLAYENGNTALMSTLFASNAEVQDSRGRAAIMNRYQDVFNTSTARSLRVENLDWRQQGAVFHGQGDFESSVWLLGQSGPMTERGVISLDVDQDQGRLVIRRMTMDIA